MSEYRTSYATGHRIARTRDVRIPDNTASRATRTSARRIATRARKCPTPTSGQHSQRAATRPARAPSGRRFRLPRAERPRYTPGVAALPKVLEQALQLSDAERGKLMAQLLHSFETDDDGDGGDLDATAWEAAWSTEIDRRVDEIRDGTIELVDGDTARARVRAAIARTR